MLKFLPAIGFASTIFFSNFSPVFSGFEEEKALIDGDLSPKTQIARICKFTLDSIDKTDPRFQRALHVLKIETTDIVPEVAKGYEYEVILGGLVRLADFATKKEPTKIDIIETGMVSGLLLSPKVIPEDFKFPIEHALYTAVLEEKENLRFSGICYQTALAMFPQLLEKFSREANARYRLETEHFTQAVLTGESAIFSNKGYIYGLSKGIQFYGLFKGLRIVHGGIIENSAEGIVHDHAHYNDVLDPARRDSDENYNRLAQIIQTLAKDLFDLIDNSPLFAEDEKEKAWLAASFLLHENKFDRITPHLLKPTVISFNPHIVKTPLAVLKEQFDWSLDVYFTGVGNLEPSSEPIEGFQYNRRFVSDHVSQICQVFPEAEAEIYKDAKGDDRNIYFNGSKAKQLIHELMDWFYIRIIGP